MDGTTFQELIAQVRGAATAVAQAEQKVAAVKAELAQQRTEPNWMPAPLC